MNINQQTRFNQLYQAYLKELSLQGKSPKTVDMYSRCIRQVSVFFDTCPDAFTSAELKIYLLSLVESTTGQHQIITEAATQFLWRVIQRIQTGQRL